MVGVVWCDVTQLLPAPRKDALLVTSGMYGTWVVKVGVVGIVESGVEVG
jgi:hypothetical protein